MHQSKWSCRTGCPARLFRLGFTKRSIWYVILSKRNCTEKLPRITAVVRQLSYLLDLARQRGITPQQIAARFQVPDIQHLTRQQCSDQIDEWRAA